MTTLCLTRTIEEGPDGKGWLRFRVSERALPDSLRPHEVLIQIEAAPINPSDIGPLFTPSYGGIGRFDGVQFSRDDNGRVTTALPLPDSTWKGLKGNTKVVGKAQRRGNEGAGRVIRAGSDAGAQLLVGKLVSLIGGNGTYAQHCVADARAVMVHHDGTTAAEAASSFVNPLTALGMVKTMRAEGHTGIVHTAAASQLGQMLLKICLKDNVPLVNVVRRPEQVQLLREMGAKWVVDTSSKTYEADLTSALIESRATICFDATGGGTLGFEIIRGMETAATRRGDPRNPYGSSTFKKLYIYGGLNAGQPVTLKPFAMGGFAWSVAGFLLDINDPKDINADDKARVASEITTTFSTTYARELSLAQMLDPKAMTEYQAQKTGTKSLVRPQLLGSAL